VTLAIFSYGASENGGLFYTHFDFGLVDSVLLQVYNRLGELLKSIPVNINTPLLKIISQDLDGGLFILQFRSESQLPDSQRITTVE